ncbi:hypothetical protein [Nocardia nepalensis]|uniref:hypothetical protein n=1 Tax=Nocardia nepalensis TaxID=3375448 RepID=UPI003B6786FF
MKTRPITFLAGALAVLLLGAAPAAADPPNASSSPVRLSASINGQEAATASADHPVRLDPGQPARVTIRVANDGPSPVDVRRVDFSGHVAGLNFFAYQTETHAVIASGAHDAITYSVDLSGLEGQATGLIGATLTARDGRGNSLASVSTVTDVHGSLGSVYGLFGLALAILTMLAIADTALAIARHRLPHNRWRRGLRLLAPGVGVGLILVFSGSAAHLWAATTGRWLVVAGAFAAAFFLIGYLSPTPLTAPGEQEEEENEFDTVPLQQPVGR